MGLAVAIQMDPIDTINIDADSTFALALEAQARGHALFHYLPQALTLHNGRLHARGRHAGRYSAGTAIITASARSRNSTSAASTSC